MECTTYGAKTKARPILYMDLMGELGFCGYIK